ncbi:MAG: DUF5916 domain-containing protein [Candidatus Latescibacterota bacterium]
MFLLAALILSVLSPLALFAHPGDLGEHVINAYDLGDSPPPEIDGRLDDAPWQSAQSQRGLQQLRPQRGEPATDDTEFYILYDRYNLYVGFRCYDAEPDKILNRLDRRGNIFPSDFISFYIDPHHDHRTGYTFATTPGGIQSDGYRYDDSSSDRNWRGIWWVESHIDDQGWTAEFKIPFANFRFPEGQKQVWGFDIERLNKRKNEWTVWKQMAQAGVYTRMSELGHIVSFSDIEPGKLFEVTPYALSGVTKTSGQSSDGQGAVGLDLQYSLTAALKANLTVNPDFAQVEADQLEINLTRFPTRFDEKRPFFVEGNSSFETPLDLFYSRRIGSNRDGIPSTIIWGSKLTGKVGDYSLGFLSSQTGGTGLLEFGDGQSQSEDALYSALRIKKDVLRRSNIGIMYAGKEWDDKHSRVGGIDANITIAQDYKLQGQYAQSFQMGADKDNSAFTLELSQRNFLWEAELALERVDPLFETNETGFMDKEQFRGWQRMGIQSSYGPRWKQHQIYVSAQVDLAEGLYDDTYFTSWRQKYPGAQQSAEFEEDLIGWESRISTGMELTETAVSGFELYFERSRNIELTDIFNANEYGFFVETNSARSASVELRGSMGDFFNFDRQAVGKQRQLSLFSTLRPRTNLAIDIGTTYAQTRDRADEVDGRFLVGSLRTTYLFTRDTFLRIFAQTEQQRLYLGEKQTDTNHLFSALFGWEYSPKSHFFVAYNETRGDTRPDNRVLLLKLSYLANL